MHATTNHATPTDHPPATYLFCTTSSSSTTSTKPSAIYSSSTDTDTDSSAMDDACMHKITTEDMPMVWGEEPRRGQEVPFDIEHMLPQHWQMDATLSPAHGVACMHCHVHGACVVRVHLGDYQIRTCFGCRACGFRWWFNKL
jgi:DNA-directed RNA polymerase subunit M/transcription elongation factor TFIIS